MEIIRKEIDINRYKYRDISLLKPVKMIRFPVNQYIKSEWHEWLCTDILLHPTNNSATVFNSNNYLQVIDGSPAYLHEKFESGKEWKYPMISKNPK